MVDIFEDIRDSDKEQKLVRVYNGDEYGEEKNDGRAKQQHKRPSQISNNATPLVDFVWGQGRPEKMITCLASQAVYFSLQNDGGIRLPHDEEEDNGEYSGLVLSVNTMKQKNRIQEPTPMVTTQNTQRQPRYWVK